jgi:long-subunit acyl-CoA synthetase (AMP-forming)
MCVSSGKLLPGVEAKIIDVNTKQCLGPNKAGHIHIKSPYLMKGYVSLNPDSVTHIHLKEHGLG